METMTKISITNRTQEVADNELSKLFMVLVPPTGRAATKAGEIVRAAMRLAYRWYNDGDMLGVGYGKETCNAAARFLEERAQGIESLINRIWGLYDETEYEQGLLNVQNYVIDYILANPQLEDEPNTENYLDWFDADEDRDDTYDDEEEEW